MDEFILILSVLEYIIRFKTMSGKIIIASGCISGASFFEKIRQKHDMKSGLRLNEV